MSRFYDALKQASKSRQSDQGDMAPDLSIFAEPELDAAAEETSTASLRVEEALAATEVPSSAASARASQNGLMGILADVELNRRARAIPNSAQPMLIEYYRQLRTKVMQEQEKKPFRSLLVTSGDPKEGKTLTVLNLAWAFSMLPSYRVLVVDGDLRRGHLSRWLGIQNRPGLANLLEGTARLDEVVFRSSSIPFQFIGLGKSKLSPPELVHGSRWPKRIREISDHFDLVIVDTPPVNLVADSQLFAEGCDAVLLVARAFRTSQQALLKVCQDFQRFRVLGLVLNGSERIGTYRQYKHYYSGNA